MSTYTQCTRDHQVAVVGYKEPLTKGQGALETPSRELPTPSEGEHTVSRDHSQGGISNNADAKIETMPQTPGTGTYAH